MLGVDFYNTSIRITTNNLFRIFTTLFPPSLDICGRSILQFKTSFLQHLNEKPYFNSGTNINNKRQQVPCFSKKLVSNSQSFISNPNSNSKQIARN